MALGKDDLVAVENVRIEMESNLKEIKDCQFSFTWVLERLQDWPYQTDVGYELEGACKDYSRLLQSTIENTEQLLARIDAFTTEQRKANTEVNPANS